MLTVAVVVSAGVLLLNVSLNGDDKRNYELAEYVPVPLPELPGNFNASAQRDVFGGFVFHNQTLCSSRASVPLLILVHSAVTHFEHRATLREYMPPESAWIFLLGQPNDSGLRELVASEYKRRGDMVVGGFHDSYQNLTRKHVMGLHWVQNYCREAQFILKLDDDIIVNFRLLQKYLTDTFPASTDSLVTRTGHRLIGGYVQLQMNVIRNQTNKWFVSEHDFKPNTYPDFCSGWAYLTTPDTIAALLAQVNGKLLWIDDVYVTGILRAASRDIELLNLNKWFNLDLGILVDWISSALANERWQWPFMFSNANGEHELMRQGLQTLRECERVGPQCKCCFPIRGHHGTSAPQSAGKGSAKRIALKRRRRESMQRPGVVMER